MRRSRAACSTSIAKTCIWAAMALRAAVSSALNHAFRSSSSRGTFGQLKQPLLTRATNELVNRRSMKSKLAGAPTVIDQKVRHPF